jgi:hypothetical protein
MKPLALVLGGILVIVLVFVGLFGFSETGQVIGPDETGDDVQDTTPPADETPVEPPPVVTDRDYTSMKDIVTEPLLFKDKTVWLTGVLKQYYWAPDDYYIEDGMGYAVRMERVNLYNFELNENYDVRGTVQLNEYCECEKREPIYLWRDYGEIVVGDCIELGRCIPGSYKSYSNDPDTYCFCEVQQFFKYYWKPEGRMNVKGCPTTEERRCQQGSFEHDDPYILVEQIEAA